jgi:hypothetical protein
VGTLTDLDGPGPATATPDAEKCVKGAVFIGFFGENVEQRWAGVDLERVARPRAHGKLVVVDIRVRNHYAKTVWTRPGSPRPHDRVQRDRVYLVREGGKWLVAKLGAVADSATIGLVDRSDPLAPPDIAAERKWYRDRLEESRAAAERDHSTGSHGYTDCASIGPVKSLEDAASDVRVVAPGRQAPAWVDLRQVSVAASHDQLCFDFESAGPAESPAALIVYFRSPGNASSGFAMDTVLTRPGEAVVGLRYPGSDERPLVAEVGTSGDRVSTVIGRDQFPTRFRELLTDFEWSAITAYTPPDDHSGQLQDTVPNYPQESGRYP